MRKRALCTAACLFLTVLIFCMNSFFSKLMGANDGVRPCRFAGSWYPAEAKQLDGDMDQYLQKARGEQPDNGFNEGKSSTKNIVSANILAIIVPHAGYAYSGKTAAFAYSVLPHNKYKRVFLLGPSHHVAFRGVALPSQEAFATPLGNLEVDTLTRQKLLAQPHFHELDEVFDPEHSLEMQLPWIRKQLGNIKLIPLAVGIVDAQEIAEIASILKKTLSDGDLIIVSSDFTHYGSRFDYQPFGNDIPSNLLHPKIKELDMAAFQTIKAVDADSLLHFYERTKDTICGIFPCSILLSLLPADSQVQLLNYRTSQDVQPDNDGNSVSYMAILFSSPHKNVWSSINNSSSAQKSQAFTQEDGAALLKIARLALADYLAGRNKVPMDYESLLPSGDQSRFMEKRGVFVTLYEKGASASSAHKQEHKQLRGCIGYIYPNKPLLQAVCQNAINAACNDPRFTPVGASELNNLDIEISILTVPSPIANYQEIKLGQDGIVLHKDGKQSVFLPKVATEFGWDLNQTLSQLSLKAGLSLYDWQEGAQFEVFQSQSFSE